MNCYLHPDALAVAYCRSCGRALCAVCQRPAEGTVFCPEHVPVEASAAMGSGPAAGNANSGNPTSASPGAGNSSAANGGAAANPYTAPPPPSAPPAAPGAMRTSPALAFLLGCIPGVGAIYNGQYVKGLVHAVIFGLLMSIANSEGHDGGEAFVVMTTMAFFFYMAFEAYHTARKRQLGLNPDEWSSLLGANRFSTTVPLGPIALIVIGILFLLQTLHVLNLRVVGRFWPVVLIGIGIAMLYARVRRPAALYPVPPYPTYTPGYGPAASAHAAASVAESGRE